MDNDWRHKQKGLNCPSKKLGFGWTERQRAGIWTEEEMKTSPEPLSCLCGPGADELRRVTDRYPFRASDYYLSLIRHGRDPLWRQAVPDIRELEDDSGLVDPLSEEDLSPVPNLVHRYPNRVLWLVSADCAMHCRFCTRKRRWQKPVPLTEDAFRAGLDYIRGNRQIKDVLLSGGDPLMLPVQKLDGILNALRRISHVEIVRIGTRVPCALPERVTPELAAMLSKYHPLFVNIHFNHPWEITEEAAKACSLLAGAGIPLGSQTVLLRGVNDNAAVLGELFQKLLAIRVRPYYLMQMDLTRGTAHFRTPVGTGLEVIGRLRNYISGLAMPHLVIDLPGGRGKVPFVPNSIEAIEGGRMMVRNYQGEICEYPLLDGEERELARWLGK